MNAHKLLYADQPSWASGRILPVTSETEKACYAVYLNKSLREFACAEKVGPAVCVRKIGNTQLLTQLADVELVECDRLLVPPPRCDREMVRVREPLRPARLQNLFLPVSVRVRVARVPV